MPRPEPWVLALVAAFSAALAVVVVFQVAAALREWRMRKDLVGSLKDRPHHLQDQASVVRTRTEVEGGLMQMLADRFPPNCAAANRCRIFTLSMKAAIPFDRPSCMAPPRSYCLFAATGVRFAVLRLRI